MTDRHSVSMSASDHARAAARHGFDLVQVDPAEAEVVLAAVLSAEVADAEARVIALWGRGRLAHDRGAIDAALTVYTEAVTIATDTGLSSLAAEVRVSWSVCLQASGRTGDALDQLRIAEPFLTGAALGRLHMQRGFLLTVVGERGRAVEEYDRALPLLLAGGDELAATRSISNRGVVLLQLGHTGRARADFLLSQEMATRLGQHVLAAGSLHNLAYLDGRLGRFPAALRGFAEARERYAKVGSPGRYVGDLDIDECGVLLEAGLAVEAERAAARVVEAARSSGNAVQLAEALVTLARGRLMLGDAAGTEAVALEAAELFTAAGRSAWAALARYLAIVAVDKQNDRRRSVVRQFVRLRDVADRLERHGWLSEAAEVRVLTGRHAIEAGRHDVAAEVLRAAAGARRHPLARVRAEAWFAAALLAEAEGNRAATRRALDAGLRSVDIYRATLGATQLRSRAAHLGEPLAAFGLRIALDRHDPLAVLRWAERCRAASIGTVPSAAAAPDQAGGVDEDLDALRRVRLDLGEARGSDPGRAAALVGEVAELEAAITRRALHRPPAGATVRRAIDVPALRRDLGTGSLIEFVEVDGALHAVVVGPRRSRLVVIGDRAAIDIAGDHLAFALRRLAILPPGPAAARHAAAVDAAAVELDEILFGPARGLLGDGPLVVVPTGGLHSVLWSALPTARRPNGVTIAPSATWWRGAAAQRRRPPSVLLVAGPDVRHAESEVEALSRLMPHAQVLAGRDATVRAVSAAMASCTLVHIAAHGVFRSDNPMFSTLLLHDGALSVHELEALPRVPETVVLTACSTGRSGVLPGDELLGTAAALMALGVRALAAPLLPIADRAAVPVAVELHRVLRRGRGMAAALRHSLVAALRSGETDAFAAAASFVCFAARRATR